MHWGMSIITRRGDDGNTDAMYGGRIPKTSPAVVACGAVDELNSALGLVRVSGAPADMVGKIDIVQQHLVSLMGLLSVPFDKREKYLTNGYPAIGQVELDWLENLAEEMPAKFDGWARPGAAGDPGAAWLDMARTICRRAEICAWDMGEGRCESACRFLNRLSDILWLWARRQEREATSS